jgi:integral membrane sensor domain MASE1
MNKEDKIKNQCVSLTFSAIVGATVQAIIGYIAVYFFKPLWDKIVKMWNKTDVH